MLYSNKRNSANSSYHHERNINSQNGGYTIAWRELGEHLVFAIAICSERDMFNKKTGRDLCDNRLDSVSLSIEGAIQVPIGISDFIFEADIDFIKSYLVDYGQFSCVTLSKAIEIVDSLTLKDLSYSAALDIFALISIEP